MKEINMLKKPCPMPVIEAKKALLSNDTDGIIMRVDNMPAVKNLEKLAKSLASDFSFEKLASNDYKISMGKIDKNAAKLDTVQNAVQSDSDAASLVVTIGSNKMGNGADELGSILIKSFLYSLTELDTPPSHLILFNSGVHLTSNDSNALDTLISLSKKGTSILSCGTCLNYYNLTDKLATGSIANMYEITQILASSSKIVNL